MNNQEVKAVARLHIESADHFMLFTLIGGRLHTAGDLSLDNVSACLINMAKCHNMSYQDLIAAFTINAKQLYEQPEQGKVIQLPGK